MFKFLSLFLTLLALTLLIVGSGYLVVYYPIASLIVVPFVLAVIFYLLTE